MPNNDNINTDLLDRRIQAQLLSMIEERERSGGGSSSGGGNNHGGNSHDGNSHDWKSSVETRLSQLHGDVRMTFYGIAGSALAIAGLIVGLYVWSGSKYDDLNNKLAIAADKSSSISERVAIVDTRSQSIENTLTSIDKRIEAIGTKLDLSSTAKGK